MRLRTLIAVLMISACAPREAKVAPSPSPSPAQTHPFQYKILEGMEPNLYAIALTWNNEVKPPTWFLQRRSAGEEYKDLATLSGEQLSWTDKEVEAGQRYEYVLGYTENGDFRVRGRAEVVVPSDFVATGALTSSDIPPAHRIFLRGVVEGTAFLTDLKLVADEIISEDAVIEFRSYLRGSSTEKLVVAAPRARGHLKIVAIGVKGRAGFRKGRNFQEEMLPLDGADSGLVHVETYSKDGFSVDVQREPGKGGKWFEEPRTPGAQDGALRPFCVRQNNEEFGDCRNFPRILKQN